MSTTPIAGSFGELRVAYVMSRFPKLTETFILREMVAMEQLGVRIELYPLLHERGALVQPAARSFVERAHYLPFLSLPILRSQLYWLGDARRRRRCRAQHRPAPHSNRPAYPPAGPAFVPPLSCWTTRTIWTICARRARPLSTPSTGWNAGSAPCCPICIR